jgi:hypothetical protein
MDALLAAMVLMAATAMLIGFESAPDKKEPFQLSMIHAAAVQPVEDWNNSIESNLTVLGYIYRNPEECSDYFGEVSEYAVYFVNNSERSKACGSLEVNKEDLSSSQTIVPDVKNSSFKGPRKAVMVMKN